MALVVTDVEMAARLAVMAVRRAETIAPRAVKVARLGTAPRAAMGERRVVMVPLVVTVLRAGTSVRGVTGQRLVVMVRPVVMVVRRVVTVLRAGTSVRGAMEQRLVVMVPPVVTVVRRVVMVRPVVTALPVGTSVRAAMGQRRVVMLHPVVMALRAVIQRLVVTASSGATPGRSVTALRVVTQGPTGDSRNGVAQAAIARSAHRMIVPATTTRRSRKRSPGATSTLLPATS